MNIDITTIANVATSISALAASISAVAAFVIYKISRRDDKLKVIRQSIVDAQLEAEELDQNFGIDLICSMTENIMNGYSINSFLTENL